MGPPLGDGTNEFDDVGFAPLRNQLVAVANNGPSALPVEHAALERFAHYAGMRQSGTDMGLIGWYYLGQQQWDVAHAWFAAAARLSTDPKLLEGEVLSLRKAGHDQEALKLADSVRSRSPGLAEQYIELVSSALTDPHSKLVLGDDDMKAFKAAVMDAKSALGAQAIGWSYIARNDLSDARSWFDNSVSWDVTEGGILGQAVVASRLKQYTVLASIKAKYTNDYPGLAKFRIYRVSRHYSRSGGSRTSHHTACGMLFLLGCPVGQREAGHGQ